MALQRSTKKKKSIIDVDLFPGIAFYLIIVLTIIIRYDFHLRDSFLYTKHIDEWVATANLPRGETYPLLGLSLMSIPFRILGYNALKGAVIVNVCLGEVVVIFIIKSARLITKKKTYALLAGIITACNQSFVTFSTEALRENSYLVCFSIIIFCSMKIIMTHEAFFVSLLGLFSGLGMACRHEGIELLLFSTILIFYANKTNFKWKRVVKGWLNLLAFWIVGIIAATLISNNSIIRTVGLNYFVVFFNNHI